MNDRQQAAMQNMLIQASRNRGFVAHFVYEDEEHYVEISYCGFKFEGIAWTVEGMDGPIEAEDDSGRNLRNPCDFAGVLDILHNTVNPISEAHLLEGMANFQNS